MKQKKERKKLTFEEVHGIVKKAIIGGSGYDPRKMLKNAKVVNVWTPYGDVDVTIGYLNGGKVAAINRHKDGYSVPAHKINHKANIFALWLLGVDIIIATNAVGAINIGMKPGDIVLPHQCAQFYPTPTFFEGGDEQTYYTDMAKPYCDSLHFKLGNIASSQLMYRTMFNPSPRLHIAGRYINTPGPRFETSFEIKIFAGMKCDIVGMTGVPEATLARELRMHYQPICVVANMAPGILSGKITPEEVIKKMVGLSPLLNKIISKTINKITAADLLPCGCYESNAPTDKLYSWYESQKKLADKKPEKICSGKCKCHQKKEGVKKAINNFRKVIG